MPEGVHLRIPPSARKPIVRKQPLANVSGARPARTRAHLPTPRQCTAALAPQQPRGALDARVCPCRAAEGQRWLPLLDPCLNYTRWLKPAYHLTPEDGWMNE